MASRCNIAPKATPESNGLVLVARLHQELHQTHPAVRIIGRLGDGFSDLGDACLYTPELAQLEIQRVPIHGLTEQGLLDRSHQPGVDRATEDQLREVLLDFRTSAEVREHQGRAPLAVHMTLHQVQERALRAPIG